MFCHWIICANPALVCTTNPRFFFFFFSSSISFFLPKRDQHCQPNPWSHFFQLTQASSSCESSREFLSSGFLYVEFVPASTQDHSCASTPLIFDFANFAGSFFPAQVPTTQLTPPRRNHAAPPGPGEPVRVSRGPQRQRRAVRAAVRRRYCYQ